MVTVIPKCSYYGTETHVPWYLHPNVSSKLPLYCYCEFSQKQRLCTTHLQKVPWYYHCILGSTLDFHELQVQRKGQRSSEACLQQLVFLLIISDICSLWKSRDLFQTNALNGKICMLHLPKYCHERSPARV